MTKKSYISISYDFEMQFFTEQMLAYFSDVSDLVKKVCEIIPSTGLQGFLLPYDHYLYVGDLLAFFSWLAHHTHNHDKTYVICMFEDCDEDLILTDALATPPVLWRHIPIHTQMSDDFLATFIKKKFKTHIDNSYFKKHTLLGLYLPFMRLVLTWLKIVPIIIKNSLTKKKQETLLQVFGEQKDTVVLFPWNFQYSSWNITQADYKKIVTKLIKTKAVSDKKLYDYTSISLFTQFAMQQKLPIYDFFYTSNEQYIGMWDTRAVYWLLWF